MRLALKLPFPLFGRAVVGLHREGNGARIFFSGIDHPRGHDREVLSEFAQRDVLTIHQERTGRRRKAHARVGVSHRIGRRGRLNDLSARTNATQRKKQS